MANPRLMIIGQLMARNLGDSTTENRLRDHMMSKAEPRWFGDEKSEFGYFFGLDEAYPRGQLSSLMMLCETGTPDGWIRALNHPDRRKYDAPTVAGIDYPALDVVRAFNLSDENKLHLETAVGTESRRGQATSFRISQLPDA